MEKKEATKTYFELTEHTFSQFALFLFIMLIGAAVTFKLFLPVLEDFFEKSLQAEVHNKPEEEVPYYMDSNTPVKETDPVTSWAVDAAVDTNREARYWFNPLIAVFLQTLTIGLFAAVIITALLPQKIGYMRQKIEREIANGIDKITVIKYGFHEDTSRGEIAEDIIRADLKSLYDFVEEWKISIDDLKILKSALKWRNAPLIYRIININDGIKIYMRQYFTLKYNNSVLGLVYIAAAVLIIIIGLRGLKFIPPTEPTLVLFALGLEFTMLIIYAFTVMYAREEDHTDSDPGFASSPESKFLGGEIKGSEQSEKLLRVFLARRK